MRDRAGKGTQCAVRFFLKMLSFSFIYLLGKAHSARATRRRHHPVLARGWEGVKYIQNTRCMSIISENEGSKGRFEPQLQERSGTETFRSQSVTTPGPL